MKFGHFIFIVAVIVLIITLIIKFSKPNDDDFDERDFYE